MSNSNLVFNLYSSCIPVKGAKRSIICDIYRKRFRFIPNALFHILTSFKQHTINDIKEKFDNEKDDFIDEYFSFLEENEFIFFRLKEEKKLFPKLNLDFDYPSTITNCIIDFDEESNYNFKQCFEQLTALNCNHWQLRFFGNFPLERVYEILVIAKDLPVSSIHLILPFKKVLEKNIITRIIQIAPICQMDFYNVPENKIKQLQNTTQQIPIYFKSENISSQTHCGKISDKSFNADINTFTEAQNHNACLNRKIGVDVKGNIKNCPSMMISFGNVNQNDLQSIIKTKQFQSVWTVSKDKIAVCKDCEFKYICTDCRAYTENPKDIFSKPLKCGYNPYTAKWSEWSANPLKKKAIEHYGMQELMINK